MKKLRFRLKHKFFNAFREIFIHHYNSLDFRAKILALIISAHSKPNVENFVVVKQIANDIYKDDSDRANLLLLTTKELVDKITQKNTLSTDYLVENIIKNIKLVPRYAKKIDINQLEKFLDLTYDEDTLYYQKHILEFLENLKKETLDKDYND